MNLIAVQFASDSRSHVCSHGLSCAPRIRTCCDLSMGPPGPWTHWRQWARRRDHHPVHRHNGSRERADGDHGRTAAGCHHEGQRQRQCGHLRPSRGPGMSYCTSGGSGTRMSCESKEPRPEGRGSLNQEGSYSSATRRAAIPLRSSERGTPWQVFGEP